MKFYVKSTRNGSDSYSSHEGMDQDTVIRLLTELGATDIQFIDEDIYNTAIVALQAH